MRYLAIVAVLALVFGIAAPAVGAGPNEGGGPLAARVGGPGNGPGDGQCDGPDEGCPAGEQHRAQQGGDGAGPVGEPAAEPAKVRNRHRVQVCLDDEAECPATGSQAEQPREQFRNRHEWAIGQDGSLTGEWRALWMLRRQLRRSPTL